MRRATPGDPWRGALEGAAAERMDGIDEQDLRSHAGPKTRGRLVIGDRAGQMSSWSAPASHRGATAWPMPAKAETEFPEKDLARQEQPMALPAYSRLPFDADRAPRGVRFLESRSTGEPRVWDGCDRADPG